MAEITLSDISLKMKNLDLCMLTTKTSKGLLTSRPMSNNGDVEYDGNSYFFTFEKSRTVEDIEENPEVNLSFKGQDNLFVSLTGVAKLVHKKEKLQEHWQEQLKKWFPAGVETPGIVLIHVKASRIKYWQGEEQGEVKM